MSTLEKILEIAKEAGYKVLKVKDETRYAFLITPDQNVLGVYEEYFGGCNLVLKYKPSRKTGTGFAAYNGYDCPTEWTLNMIKEDEKELIENARKIKAEFYSSPEEWKAYEESFYGKTFEEVA